MSDPRTIGRRQPMDDPDQPVHAGDEGMPPDLWAQRLVTFLRAMAAVSMLKGLYHWAIVCGIDAPTPGGFADYPTPYQSATAFFAVIDLVAAVGLWLAAPWGAVVWLTSVISMIAVEMLFPQIYGGRILLVIVEFALLGTYLVLALRAAREQPI
jgi:Family of unknown function (DUF6163)